MKEVYALSAYGNMLYFEGDIPEKMYYKIDEIAQQLEFPYSAQESEILNRFVDMVHNQLNIKLFSISIKHIFRHL